MRAEWMQLRIRQVVAGLGVAAATALSSAAEGEVAAYYAGCAYERERAWADVTRTPEEKCYDRQALDGALATLPSGSSWIVLADGAVISESNADTLRTAASFSKSLIGLAVAMCVDDGFCDWQQYDEELNHRAGWTNPGHPPCVDGGTAGSWAYSTCGFSRAAEALESAVSVDLASYLHAKLSPLGVGIEWDGSHSAGTDARMSVRDAARILLMLARDGSWRGQAIVSETAVEDLVSAGCNPGVPFASPASYAQPIGVAPPLVYCRGFWLTNHLHLAGVAHGGFGGQGGIDGQGFVGYVLDRDTVVVTAGPNARPAPGGQNHVDGQPFAEIVGARTGIGLSLWLDRESACGLGWEIVLPLALLAGLRAGSARSARRDRVAKEQPGSPGMRKLFSLF